MLIIIWRGLEELNFRDKFNRLGFYHWTKSPKMTRFTRNGRNRTFWGCVFWTSVPATFVDMVFAVPPTSRWLLMLVSFLGLSVVLSCAIFRVVQACPSEVTSPLTSISGNYGGGIRTLMGSYPVYPRTASPLRYYTRHLCTLLIRLICLC